MLEPDRLNGLYDWIDQYFLEREVTPEPATKLGLTFHLAFSSLSNSVSILDELGFDRHRTTVRTWVKKLIYSPPAVPARVTTRWTKP